MAEPRSIGPSIGDGRTATIRAYGDDRVIKVLRPGFGAGALDRESWLASAVVAAGAPAPATHGIVDVDGARGLVFDRIDGDLLLDEIALDPMRFRQWARMLASTHVDILTSTSEDLPDRTEVMAERIEAVDLGHEERSAALNILAKAPGGSAVLHGDFHPGNVFITLDGPQVIDWIDAARGHPAADIARTEWLLTGGGGPSSGVNRHVVERLRRSFVRRYLRLVTRSLRVDRRVLDAWRLPTLAARLWEGIDDEEDRIRSEIRSMVG